jgi:type IV pilus assembly protein PilA
MTIKNQKGFTLVELLVVIAIIAILGVVAIAAINPVAKINSAKDNQALANVQQISKALEACLADRMATAGVTAAVATDNCCGTAVANAACVSTAAAGLGLYGYGFTQGWPTGVTANRGAAAGTAICAAQQRGSDTNYVKYVVGGGTVNTASATNCVNGV